MATATGAPATKACTTHSNRISAVDGFVCDEGSHEGSAPYLGDGLVDLGREREPRVKASESPSVAME